MGELSNCLAVQNVRKSSQPFRDSKQSTSKQETTLNTFVMLPLQKVLVQASLVSLITVNRGALGLEEQNQSNKTELHSVLDTDNIKGMSFDE